MSAAVLLDMPTETPTAPESVSPIDLMICKTEQTLRMPPLRAEGLQWYERQLATYRPDKLDLSRWP